MVERQHAPTIWELAEEYSLMVSVVSNPAAPARSYALVRVPYFPEMLGRLRACGFWVSEKKAWRVPMSNARQLSEVLYAVSQRSRDP
jgi:hypothetical protein